MPGFFISAVDTMTTLLQPDRDQIERFGDATLRHVGHDGFVSLRSFDMKNNPFIIQCVGLNDGLVPLFDAAEDIARRCAQAAKPITFCPPVASFNNTRSATERDVLDGPTISVDLDNNSQRGLALLERVLGPATIVVRSGGTWSNGNGEGGDKLHAHWRLTHPARGDDLVKLKLAREMAAHLVGADPSLAPICHPLRWPGSWHRKAEPKLCQIAVLDADREIDLETAIEVLRRAVSDMPAAKTAPNTEERPRDAVEGWGDHIEAIIAGANLHDSIIKLAAKMVASGMNDGAAVNFLRDLMERSAAPRDDRWQMRYDDIPRGVETARAKYQKPDQENVQPLPLPLINFGHWDAEPTPNHEWAVPDRVPLRQTALFTGEGGTGKSTVTLHQCCAHVLGRDWLGSLPEIGPAIYLDAEDDEKAIHIRLACIARHYDVTYRELMESGLHLMSFVGRDAVLATASRNGKIEPTALYDQIYQAVGDIKPKLIGIASSANVFAGNESDRSQVQQFVALLTRLAILANGSVQLISHPSLAGINNDTGLSGSTQWHNAVRARSYLKGIKPESGEQPDDDVRELVFRKNQYGKLADRVILKYRDGMYLPMPGMASLVGWHRRRRHRKSLLPYSSATPARTGTFPINRVVGMRPRNSPPKMKPGKPTYAKPTWRKPCGNCSRTAKSGSRPIAAAIAVSATA